ncbi:MAG: hypothetical protein ABEK10_00235 [Candidatus Nanosalina sp.]
MSHAEKEVLLSDVEREILWGISTTTQELRNNYRIILRTNKGSEGWSDEELEFLEKEMKHIEELHSHLESLLNQAETMNRDRVKEIIKEERNAERIEGLLEKKYENGNLEMGGKNTVKLTKALSEFAEVLKTFEKHSYAQTDSLDRKKFRDKLKSIDGFQGVNGENGKYLFGGIRVKGELKFEEEGYSKSDYIVLDSLNFPYREKGFEEFVRRQPNSGRFDYEELISENVFREQKPVVIPDVIPSDSYRGFDLTKIDDWNKRIQVAAFPIGNFGLPAAIGLASQGALPMEPVMIGAITWKTCMMGVLPMITLPRILTAVGARMALFCEKLDSYFAARADEEEPTFFLYVTLKEAPLIAAFMKSPKLRRKVLEIHHLAGFEGLEEEYLDYMEEIEFIPEGLDEMQQNPENSEKFALDYNGRKRVVRYSEQSFDTGVTSEITSKAEKQDSSPGVRDRISAFFT